MEFIDQLGHQVVLKKEEPVHDHVLVIALYQNQFVLTHHQIRGIEFPGGKREIGETTFDAAHRELYEETGGRAVSMDYITTYTVFGETSFKKDVFLAQIDSIEDKADYMETWGPVVVNQLEDVKVHRSRLLDDACINYIVKEMISCGWIDD
ncbi:NUDIX domain-containing protein [Macrococcus lamae]|uniref:NUDIX domain-containing protein n=1 Tax=Macrococcus lamae TaxID=198484 RepID=A0A4R6BT64_9STAP|nr:NUDIX domain-containing protein [Macrococcus lamae]TDM07497.1 NUDIX domain-containing protein [Macrococcus lamae]